MRPRLFAVHFGGGQYERLARVLEYTARSCCPGWDVDVRRVDPTCARTASGSQSDANNHYKLGLWREQVDGLEDGRGIILLDADTFVTRDLDPLWREPFDVAYTVRDVCKFPLNAGVIAARGGPRAREFFRAWYEADMLFTRDRILHSAWRKTYGGQNQASLGFVLEDDPGPEATVAQLPCLEWNCEDTCWERFDPALTRIVHAKSALRLAAFGLSWSPRVGPLARAWKDLEKTANLCYNRS